MKNIAKIVKTKRTSVRLEKLAFHLICLEEGRRVRMRAIARIPMTKQMRAMTRDRPAKSDLPLEVLEQERKDNATDGTCRRHHAGSGSTIVEKPVSSRSKTGGSKHRR